MRSQGLVVPVPVRPSTAFANHFWSISGPFFTLFLEAPLIISHFPNKLVHRTKPDHFCAFCAFCAMMPQSRTGKALSIKHLRPQIAPPSDRSRFPIGANSPTGSGRRTGRTLCPPAFGSLSICHAGCPTSFLHHFCTTFCTFWE